MMKKQFLQTIKEHDLFQKNQHIVLGLSGGPDSVCLFYMLKEIQEEYGLTLHAVHVNHKLRPGAAEEDQEYVKKLCEKEKVDCFVNVVDCHAISKVEGITCEEAGRNARYSAFAQAAQKLVDSGIPREDIIIAVAHNKEDQAETILFRMLRGTGTDGLAGMAYKRTDRYENTIVRPILDISRKDIEEYLKDNNITPRIDKTNSEAIYTRNKIRLELIPYLEENFNSNIVNTLARLGHIAAEDKDALWKAALDLYQKSSCGKMEFSLAHLRSSEKAVCHRLYSMALEKLGLNEDVTMAHILSIDNLVYGSDKGPSKMVMLPRGIKVSKMYDRLSFNQSTQPQDLASWQVSIMSRQEYETKEKQIPYGAFDFGKIVSQRGADQEELTKETIMAFNGRVGIRLRRDGDYLKLAAGTKKLQDLLVDEKVPKPLRNSIPLLAIDREILWVLPSDCFKREQLREKGRFSAKYSVDNESKWILFVEKTV